MKRALIVLTIAAALGFGYYVYLRVWINNHAPIFGTLVVQAAGKRPNYWIITAPMFRGCGYEDAEGERHIRKGCKTYSYELYWTGAGWSLKRSDAKRYPSSPSTEGVSTQSGYGALNGIDVVEVDHGPRE